MGAYSKSRVFVTLFILVFLLETVFVGQISVAETDTSSNSVPSEGIASVSEAGNRTETVALPVVLQAGVADDQIVTFTRSGEYVGVWGVCFDGVQKETKT